MPAPSCRFVAAGKRHDFAIEARSKQDGEAVRKQRESKEREASMTFQKTQIEPPMLNDVPAAFLRDQKEKGLRLCWLDQRTTRAAQAWIKKAWAECRKEIISNSHPPIGGIFCYDCCECRGDYAKNDGTGAMVERLLLLLRLRLCAGLAFLRYRTLGRGFCCRASLRPARFLR